MFRFFVSTLAAAVFACTVTTLAGAADAGSCQVVLSRLSYDDPSADDAEFIELRVPDAPGRVRLGDCGLSEIRLLDGSGPGCEVYRTLALAEFLTDTRGYFVICSAKSQLHEDIVCDYTGGSSSGLPNGWLQNGPDDGVELFGEESVLVRYSYAVESGSCASADTVSLPKDANPSSSTDDALQDMVIVACETGYELVPLTAAPLRSAHCPELELESAPPDAGLRAESELDGGEHDVSSATPARGSVLQQEGSVVPLPWDAAAVSGVPDSSATPTSPHGEVPQVGCSLPAGRAGKPVLDGLLPAAALLLVCRRRRTASLPAVSK